MCNTSDATDSQPNARVSESTFAKTRRKLTFIGELIAGEMTPASLFCWSTNENDEAKRALPMLGSKYSAIVCWGKAVPPAEVGCVV